MSSFDDAPSFAIALIQEDPAFADLNRVVLVRDLRGRVRIVLEPSGGRSGPDISTLEHRLGQYLGRWFHGPILSTGGSPQDARAARTLLELAVPWVGAREVTNPETGERGVVASSWRLLSRRLSKDAWLSSGPASPPWPLETGNPAIVAFHSFKGGVGRSTTLASVATLLAERGKRVLCIDLDLESPGLDAVLGAQPGRGSLDLLLEHVVTGQFDAADAIIRMSVHGQDFDLLPAGVVDRSFAEKLARLDYTVAGVEVGNKAQSPVAVALTALLGRLRGLSNPDYILLDLRSGLSDLAGISLVMVAHVDVVVSRSGRQGETGLGVVLPLLRERRPPREQRLIIVHALGPLPYVGAAMEAERNLVRAAAWNLLYTGELDAPALDDPTAMHHPWSIAYFEEIQRAESLGQMSVSTLHNDGLLALASRIEELCVAEEPEDE